MLKTMILIGVQGRKPREYMMSRDIRMLPIRTVGIILTVAGVLAAGVIVA
jgi:hypothetical protein